VPPRLPNKVNYWSTFNGRCLAPHCRANLSFDGGIFCANFYTARGTFAPCKSAWCGEHFVPLGNKPFPVRQLLDEDGEDLEAQLDSKRFRQGRDGDHLMTPFQCELCHFRNIFWRDPYERSSIDKEALEFFRRASLDAFWSRAPSTVRGNLNEGKRTQRFVSRFGLPSLIPAMGLFPLEDSMGMMVAASILDRSLDPGLTEEFVQWETFRGTRSFVTNATQAGVTGLSEVVGAYERNRMWISGVVTHSFWFTRFMEGLHKRVGEVKRQDEPITIDVLHALEAIMEGEWILATRPEAKRRVAEMGTWFISGFCSGLRGEEMLLIELAGTTKSLKFLSDPICPHFILVITGLTKGNQKGGAKFGVPIVARTKGTFLQPGKWIKRLCEARATKGDKGGRLFKRQLVPARLYEFEEDFFRLLREVQATTSFIEPDVVVETEYGILRSNRRGMTSHSRNMGISKPDLNTFNRWTKEANSQTGLARLDMADTYTSLPSIKPLLLRVTSAF
jgi:hypothetical protein